MRELSRLLLSISILAPLMACGGSPVAPTIPVSNVPTQCRTYATARTATITVSGSGFSPVTMTESESCQFDRAARVLRCHATVSAGCTTRTESTTYASVADFVEEAQAVGRERFQTL